MVIKLSSVAGKADFAGKSKVAESKISRLVKTLTFRLAMVYVGLFSISVVILFAFIYSFAMNYVEEQVNDAVRMQYGYLINEYHQSGSAGVEARIKELIANDDEGIGIFLLVNRDNEKLVGNLNEWPTNAHVGERFEKNGNWAKFYIEGSRNSQGTVEVKAVIIQLSTWRKLLVGQTMQNSQKIEQIIMQTFWASFLITLVMAFVGAVVMTRSVMYRINIINRSAQTIMHGDITVRIPFTEGGDEFDDLSSNLNMMLDRIESLLKSIGQFANNIAHDLRSPLNRIINRLDAGLRKIEDENPARKLLEKNIQDMQELISTFNSILKISELEANTEFRDFTPCDLQKIIENLVEFYEPYAGEKNIALNNKIKRPVLLSGEKNLLTQAFANLIDNAIKFTGKDGHVDIYYEEDSIHRHIIIADNGIGIPHDYHDKVFEKFFRLEQSRNTKGNGLGLSLVEAVARIHDAEIKLLDNSPGLKVIISFPVA